MGRERGARAWGASGAVAGIGSIENNSIRSKTAKNVRAKVVSIQRPDEMLVNNFDRRSKGRRLGLAAGGGLVRRRRPNSGPTSVGL